MEVKNNTKLVKVLHVKIRQPIIGAFVTDLAFAIQTFCQYNVYIYLCVKNIHVLKLAC